MSERKCLSINPLWAAAFAVAALALTAAACNDPVANQTRCDNVSCEEPLQCDLGDGVCKCGGTGGIICGAGGTCTEGKCVYNCGDVKCTGGTMLDPLDCKCKCGGQGGATCGADERCDTASRKCYLPARCDGVVCGTGMTCDPADGACKCGGTVCEKFQSCQAGQCVADACAGVTCTGGTVCSPADGKCHCGGQDGSVCSYGEMCGCPTGATCAGAEKRCLTSTLCQSVQCAGGTTCDPADGACKCGGPGGPVCQPGQSCDVLNRICIGGDRCKGVLCTGGLTCDPESGTCKCGGLNGKVCVTGEICVSTTDRSQCATPCNPRAPVCPANLACYWDIYAKLGYCMPKGDNNKTDNTGCFFKRSFDPAIDVYPCAAGFHCQEKADEAGICRKYCDKSHGAGDCSSASSQQDCFVLDGAPTNLGACNVLQN